MNEVAKREYMPRTISEKLEMSDLMAKSGLLPPALNTKEKVFVALQWGDELGLSPMVAVTNIAVINGKPSLSADIMHAIVRGNPEYAGTQWVCKDNKKAEVVLSRRCGATIEKTRVCYTIEDAQNAGLLGKDNWKKYPARMLKHRALSFALRDAFPDVLSGIYDKDEISGQTVDVTPQEEPANVEVISEPVIQIDYANEIKDLLNKSKELSHVLPKESVETFRQVFAELQKIKDLKERFERTLEVVSSMEIEVNEAEKQMDVF